MSIRKSPVCLHGRRTRNANRLGIASTVAKSLLMTFGIATASMLISRGMGAATETPAVCRAPRSSAAFRK